MLLDGKKYEEESEIETKGSVAFQDSLRPKPGQTNLQNAFYTNFGAGIPLKSTNSNLNWNNFVTGFKLKGDTITKDSAKTYYTNIKITPSE